MKLDLTVARVAVCAAVVALIAAYIYAIVKATL